MDHNSKSHHQQHLGVNKLGKSIRKSPLHQPSFQKIPPPFHNQQPPTPPQPQVYNISKSDFRSIVQQLTGSPARDPSDALNNPPPSRPPQPKPPSSRLMKIRPPPLTPIARPPSSPFQNTVPIRNPNPNVNLSTGLYPRPVPSTTAPPGAAWADSPVSAYMRYLESSLLSSDSSRRPPAQGLLPSSHFPAVGTASYPSPRGNPHLHPPTQPPTQPGLLPSPGSQVPLLWPGLQFPSPGAQFPLPSPNSQLPLPSPNSQLPLPSPSSFLNLLSPKSPYPLISPGFQFPPPTTPNFSFSPMPQSGILGPGPGPQPSPSPNLLFPPSPSGLLPLLSPRWREM